MNGERRTMQYEALISQSTRLLVAHPGTPIFDICMIVDSADYGMGRMVSAVLKMRAKQAWNLYPHRALGPWDFPCTCPVPLCGEIGRVFL